MSRKKPVTQARILDFNTFATKRNEEKAEMADAKLKTALCEKLLARFPLDKQLANLIVQVVDSDVSGKAVAAIIETL